MEIEPGMAISQNTTKQEMWGAHIKRYHEI